MRIAVIFLLLPLLGFGQGSQDESAQNTSLTRYLDLYTQADGGKFDNNDDLLSFINKLSAKRETFKSEKAFLNHVFVKTHQHYLKHYTDYVSFSTMINKGTYNCLTGTALYALLLDYFKFDHQIIETNYHIFLLVNTGEGQVLLETTDPQNGFVEEEKQIEKRIITYRQNTIEEKQADKSYYRFSYELYREVNLDEMLGLLHYNLAIVAYNDRQFQTSISQLDKALELYQSPRIEELSRIILLSVLESKLDPLAKEDCVRKIQLMRKNKLMIAARATLH